MDIANAWDLYGLSSASKEFLEEKFFEYTKDLEMINAFVKAAISKKDLTINLCLCLLTITLDYKYLSVDRNFLFEKTRELLIKQNGDQNALNTLA